MNSRKLERFLCQLFGHKQKFVRGERRERFGGEELVEEYECLRCGKEWAWVSGTGSILVSEANPRPSEAKREKEG